MAAVGDRPKTLEESKEWLLERLRSGRSPMVFADDAEARATIARLRSLDWEHWASVWGETAARFEQAAQEAEARDDADAAAKAHFQAYVFYSLGRYPCPNHPRKQECAVKARESFLRAARGFDPPLERDVIPFDGADDEPMGMAVHLRKPKGVARPPVMVMHGGVDSYKEERYDVSNQFLAAGIATVAIDMPGTGESPVRGSPTGERQYTAVFDWIRWRDDLDAARVGLMGMSFGGYWATKVAHTHREHLALAVNWGGGAHLVFQPDWTARARYPDSYLTDLTESRGYSMGIASYDEYVAYVPKLSLLDQGLLDRPCAPMLCVNGKDDRQTPIQDIYLLLEHGDPKDARVFPGGHMGQTPRTLPTILAWVCERLRPNA